MITRWKQQSLRFRLITLMGVLILVTVGGSLITFWYAYQIRQMVTLMIDKDIAALRTGKELQISLMNQKGLVTYYFLNGNHEWLKQLEEHQRTFEELLHRAKEDTTLATGRTILNQLAMKYAEYLNSRNRVVELYKIGQRESGADLHWDLRAQFSSVNDLCKQFEMLHEKNISKLRNENFSRANVLQGISLISIIGVLTIGFLLAGVLITQVMNPIRELTRAVSTAGNSDMQRHEIMALSQSVEGLLENVDRTRTKLEASRAQLLNSEKMALVGKLAAEMAHSIRNPLTSIKMRLFSLQKDIDLSPPQAENLEAISGELRRMDTILCNFLAFSRPPRLETQTVDLSTIVAGSLRLLEKRLEQQTIEVVHTNPPMELPSVKGDPELLKEALVNIIVNACDAMPTGGCLRINVDQGVAETIGNVVLIRINDTGPGIPWDIQGKVMEPFFSTKPDGTGLGLSIANRIVEQHGGRIEIRSTNNKGTTFTVILPV